MPLSQLQQRARLEPFAKPLLGVAVRALARVRLVVWRTLDGLESALHLLLRRRYAAEQELLRRDEMLPGERLFVFVTGHDRMANRLAADCGGGENLDGLDFHRTLPDVCEHGKRRVYA